MIENINGGCRTSIPHNYIVHKYLQGDIVDNISVSDPTNLSTDMLGSFSDIINIPNTCNALLVPMQHRFLGIYNYASNNYTNGPAHNAGQAAYSRGINLDNGYIFLCPYRALNIGLYEIASNNFTLGPSVANVSIVDPAYGRFIDCIKINSKVYLIPETAKNIVVYDINSNTISISSSNIIFDSSLLPQRFSSACQISSNEILLVPFAGYSFSIYNTDEDSISTHISTNLVAYSLGRLTKVNNEIFIIYKNGGVSVYNINNETINTYAVENSYAYNDAFGDIIHTGKKLVLIPKRCQYIGEFDISTKTYQRGNDTRVILPDQTYRNFYTAGCAINTAIIMAPSHASNVGIYQPESSLS